jgi:crotonobetainyl-CoA:carnitine CoA-transferase CaiB-like acyl-CoA transferase
MASPLDGIRVLDLSRGIAGPMTAMLLADHGADVIRVESPGGDPFASSGYQVWQRSKRNAVLDLNAGEDRQVFLDLACGSDIVVESFSPGAADRLGIGYGVLRGLNPRLIYCSITGYGESGRLAERPGIDALVAARTGQQWESRGVDGGTLARLSGVEGTVPDLDAPAELRVGAPRPGPLFGGVPWVSLGAFYLASLAINAALRAREITGRGQHVGTSLLQGALVTTVYPWQRAARPESDGYQSWVIDPRAPKGFFRCGDGRWIHQWNPLPSFMLGVSEGRELTVSDGVTDPRRAPMRIATHPEEMVLLFEYIPQMGARAARFSSSEWARVAAEVGVPLQPVRSPEEALDDPLLLADGCVVEVDDATLGPVRQVGRVCRLSAYGWRTPTPPAERGQHTEVVRREAAELRRDAVGAASAPPVREGVEAGSLDSPLQGIVVLDLGLAVAGPFGAQLLGLLGARVIKVQQLKDGYFMGNHVGMAGNMGKESLGIDLKTETGFEVLRRLVEKADVVTTNMRYGAACRLHVDYESLRLINPSLVYCHTRGFEHGERENLPGNDQTAAALAGTEWLEGGLDNGGSPIWPVTSLGDTGNGLLSALAVVQAIWHRDRTGEGQFVETSIMYAHLLNTSMAWTTPDGSVRSHRPSLDAMQLGWGPLYRLYRTADEWLCLAAWTEDHWQGLCRALGEDAPTALRFSTPEGRKENLAALGAHLEGVFSSRSAQSWFQVLDAQGVPCEVTHENRVIELFEDAELYRKGWLATYDHPLIGRVDTAGLLFDFSETPGKLWGPAPVVGQHSRDILTELGYDNAAIDDMVAAGTVADPGLLGAKLSEPSDGAGHPSTVRS